MKHLILMSLALFSLSACGKKDVVENNSALDGLAVESSPANDASALEAVEAENARLLVDQLSNETEVEDNSDSNAAANESGNVH